MKKTKIKICGLTNPDDIKLVSQMGIDMAGFIFAPQSPRHLSLEQAQGLSSILPKKIKRVGVFVDAHQDMVREAISSARLDLLQFHGQESPQYCRQFGIPFIKAFRVKERLNPKKLASYQAQAILLDAYSPHALGGTGEIFNWDLAREMVETGFKIILAGGLNPKNIIKALSQVDPWGVDVSSGVEDSPGIKNADKVKTFISQVRESHSEKRPKRDRP